MTVIRNLHGPTIVQRGMVEIAKLTFITTFFGWVFLLLTRLAEPAMSLSAIYIIVCSGVASWKIEVVYNLAIAFLLATPEIILPGAFLLSNTRTVQGKQGVLLRGICWAFVLLTFITMLQLFVWHLDEQVQSLIMCARCAASICYSILLRVIHQEPVPSSPPQPVSPAPDELVTPSLVDVLTQRLQPELTTSVLNVVRTELHETLATLRTAHACQSPVPKAVPTAAADLKTSPLCKPVPVPQSTKGNITLITRKVVTDNHVVEAYEKLASSHPQKKVTAEELRLAAGISKDRACRFLREHADTVTEVSEGRERA